MNKVNENELKAAAIRKGMSIPDLAQQIGISKKRIYSRMHGATPFRQTEITKIRDCLGLTDEELISIFFTSDVS